MDILVIDDEPSIRVPFEEALRDEGYTVQTAADGLRALELIESHPFDVILSDIRLPKLDGLQLFNRVRARFPDTHYILMTAYASVPDAVAALKGGAVDYLAKPFDLEDVLARVAKIARERALSKELASARGRGTAAPDSLPAALRNTVARFAESAAPVLITGERGSGKEMVARALHRLGPRQSRPFAALRCAATPPAALEAELFGDRHRPGAFRTADGGTLFLDEVTALPADLQAKLVHVLESGAYQPLDNPTPRAPNVRYISSSQESVPTRVEQRAFREDLYHRLGLLELTVPPLRERPSEFVPLVEELLRSASAPLPPPGITGRALAALAQYRFPGNVRELENALRQAVTLAAGKPVDLPHLAPAIAGAADPAQAAGSLSLSDAIKEFERDFLRKALQRTQGKRLRAAQLLGISRKNLWEKLRDYGIDPDDEG